MKNFMLKFRINFLTRLSLKWKSLKWSCREKVISFKLRLLNNNFDVYGIEVENTGYEDALAVIFGYNKYFLAPNHGSHRDIKITNLMTRDPFGYAHLLAESQLNTDIAYVKVLSDKDPVTKFPVIYYKSHKAFGWMSEYPFPPQNHLSPYQTQSGIVEICENFKINGNNYFDMILKPQQKLQIFFIQDNKKPNYKPPFTQ